MNTVKRSLLFGLYSVFFMAFLGACCSLKNEQKETLNAFLAEREAVQKHIETFDALDFDVYSDQEWDRLRESHAENIVVYYPDGSTTTGLADHIAELKKTFVFAPDTRVTQHPIKTGSGKYTAVIGVAEGTFTKPMPIGNGKFIKPTNKKYKYSFATFSVWENGVMTEEYLFWDNQAFMKQIGVIK
ncbi:MAG: ester cyclase [Endomicrobium sp.]|jgi:hypothetical protein|nr:ester cyclase [Endomicrobium sp.]